jgi:hypothetical protein
MISLHIRYIPFKEIRYSGTGIILAFMKSLIIGLDMCVVLGHVMCKCFFS